MADCLSNTRDHSGVPVIVSAAFLLYLKHFSLLGVLLNGIKGTPNISYLSVERLGFGE
jgi:hypothetical protein